MRERALHDRSAEHAASMVHVEHDGGFGGVCGEGSGEKAGVSSAHRRSFVHPLPLRSDAPGSPLWNL